MVTSSTIRCFVTVKVPAGSQTLRCCAWAASMVFWMASVESIRPVRSAPNLVTDSDPVGRGVGRADLLEVGQADHIPRCPVSRRYLDPDAGTRRQCRGEFGSYVVVELAPTAVSRVVAPRILAVVPAVPRGHRHRLDRPAVNEHAQACVQARAIRGVGDAVPQIHGVRGLAQPELHELATAVEAYRFAADGLGRQCPVRPVRSDHGAVRAGLLGLVLGERHGCSDPTRPAGDVTTSASHGVGKTCEVPVCR